MLKTIISFDLPPKTFKADNNEIVGDDGITDEMVKSSAKSKNIKNCQRSKNYNRQTFGTI